MHDSRSQQYPPNATRHALRARPGGLLALAAAISLGLAAMGPARVLAQVDTSTPASTQAAPPSTSAPNAEPAAVAEPTANAPAAANAQESDKPLDFFTDIQPIFAAHCIKCHGADRRSGGLRLDAMEFALAGGDSDSPIVGGTLETNELYRRVSSDERAYRMPKNAEPLSPAELSKIKRWVEHGAIWPVAGLKAADPSTYDRWVQWVDQMIHRYESEYLYVRPYAAAFVAVQLLLLAISRGKGAYQRGRAWASGKFGKLCARISSRELTLVWVLSVLGVVIVVMHAHQIKLVAEVQKLQMAQARRTSNWSNTVFGWPPVPIRPDQPKQVAGTYYRGNCERNPELFNGGNYLTATFRVNLCDESGKPLNVGDPLPNGTICVRFEIERGPNTTDLLFTKELMGSVFLSEIFYESATADLRDKPVKLETLAEGQRWQARFPLGSHDDQEKLDGLIYVYTGRVDEKTARGEPQYAIKYDLRFADGTLTGESDLWMGSFTNSAIVSPEPAGKVPFREWFDYRPIPTISGKNTRDPKLLGIEEYENKGLITPQPPPQVTPQAEK